LGTCKHKQKGKCGTLPGGKVPPTQVTGDPENPVPPSHTVMIEFVSTDKTRREESVMNNPVADQALTHKRTPMARRMG
jgi:hypothetical protein